MAASITEVRSASTRRPYYGSCHCGRTRYICYLTLPPQDTSPTAGIENTRIRKCNCTSCHKASNFSVRLIDAPNDFVLLSPLDPFTSLTSYTFNTRSAHWWFCPTCGVRCLMFGRDESNTENVEIDLEAWLGKESQGTKTKVWRPKKERWCEENQKEGEGTYLSVFAQSLDAGQEGLDLREWHEKGWIVYFGEREETRGPQKTPFAGGMY